MIDLLTSIISGICGFLSTVLPDSPFQDIVASTSALHQGLGWLNWFVPVADLALIFAAWLTVLLIWAAVDFALTKGEGIIGKVIGQ